MTNNADPGAPATGTETTTASEYPVGHHRNPAPMTPASPATGDVDDMGDDDKDWKAEHEKVLAASRKWEDRAKANAQAAKELEELRKQSMTDMERAVDEAKAAGRAEATIEFAGERVADAVRVAAAGRPVDVDALLEGINTARFVDDSGQPDRKAIEAWLNKVAPVSTEPTIPGVPDLGQGGRGQPASLNGTQLERDVKAALGILR